MKLIILNENGFYEWSPNSKNELPPNDAIEVADDHWTMTGYNAETHYPDYDTLTLVAFTQSEIDARTATKAQEQTNNEALSYLAQTDWYVVRFTETGVAIPNDIKLARQAARNSIVGAP